MKKEVPNEIYTKTRLETSVHHSNFLLYFTKLVANLISCQISQNSGAARARGGGGGRARAPHPNFAKFGN